MKILRFLWTYLFHKHKWVEIDRFNLYEAFIGRVTSEQQVFKCEICGKIKMVEV